MRVIKKVIVILYVIKDVFEEYEFIFKVWIDVIYNGIKLF